MNHIRINIDINATGSTTDDSRSGLNPSNQTLHSISSIERKFHMDKRRLIAKALEHQNIKALEHQNIKATKHQNIKALEHQTIVKNKDRQDKDIRPKSSPGLLAGGGAAFEGAPAGAASQRSITSDNECFLELMLEMDAFLNR